MKCDPVSGKENIIEFEIKDVVFDTAASQVEMTYDAKRGSLSVHVFSSLSKIHKATKEWEDLVSYGQCMLITRDFDTLREIADSIQDKEWMRVQDNKETLFKDEKIKQAVLKRLYNAGTDLGDFLEERLKEGCFDDITDSEGWTNLWQLILRLEDMYLDDRIHDAFRMLIKDLPNADSRFLIKEPDIETRRLMDGSSWSVRPIEKYGITRCSFPNDQSLKSKLPKSKENENQFVIKKGILIDGRKCQGSVTIPDSVTEIDSDAFEDCTCTVTHQGKTYTPVDGTVTMYKLNERGENVGFIH